MLITDFAGIEGAELAVLTVCRPFQQGGESSATLRAPQPRDWATGLDWESNRVKFASS